MHKRHKLVWYGSAKHNPTARMGPSSMNFVTSEGGPYPIRRGEIPGIEFSYQSADQGRRVFMVQGERLRPPFIMKPGRYWTVGGPAPNGKRLTETEASKLLEDILAATKNNRRSLIRLRGLIRQT